MVPNADQATPQFRALVGQSVFLFMDIGEVAREMAEVVTLKRPGPAPKTAAGFVA